MREKVERAESEQKPITTSTGRGEIDTKGTARTGVPSITGPFCFHVPPDVACFFARRSARNDTRERIPFLSSGIWKGQRKRLPAPWSAARECAR